MTFLIFYTKRTTIVKKHACTCLQISPIIISFQDIDNFCFLTMFQISLVKITLVIKESTEKKITESSWKYFMESFIKYI